MMIFWFEEVNEFEKCLGIQSISGVFWKAKQLRSDEGSKVIEQ